jgi:putative transposase
MKFPKGGRKARCILSRLFLDKVLMSISTTLDAGNPPLGQLGLEVEFCRCEGVLQMKKSSFTDSQIAEALKRVEAGLSVPELCREMGVSSATFYKWRAKYGEMDTSMMARLSEVEVDSARLKKMCAVERLKAEILNEAFTKKC